MKVSEFYEKLAALPRRRFRPTVDCSGAIRLRNRRGELLCPVTAVCLSETGAILPIDLPSQAARDIGLRPSAAENIVLAADDPNVERSGLRLVRRRLLAALKLKET